MPAGIEGLLDHGRLEDVQLKSSSWKPSWKPSRPPRLSLDLFKPEFTTLYSAKPKHTLRPTAWLDGLRGFAAFLVYLQHNQLWSHGIRGNVIFENAFGYQGKHYFAALPFVRIFFSGGHFAVAVFFVISGYVLSIKSMGLIHKGQTLGVAESIGSALFRRWLRLYIPIIAVTFAWMTFRHATKIWVDLTELKGTYREEVVNWYYMFKNYSFVFSENIYQFSLPYHQHTWSIPFEFKGSIIVYTTLSALSKCTKNARLWCEAALIFYFMYIVDGFYGAMFISGMLLCDLDLLAQSGELPRIFTRLSDFKEFIFFHLFLVALYLAGVPSCDGLDMSREKLMAKSPGWKWLAHLKPQAVFDAKWFYLFWAAFLAVAAIPRLPWLKRFFENRYCQYLGRISFALYLVHGIVIWTIGDRVYAAVGLDRATHQKGIPNWRGKIPLPTSGPMGLEPAFWIAQIILIPFTFYFAEVVTKAIDEPSVKFTNWLYRQVLARPTPQPQHKRSFSSAC